jgi:hypothetical protein
MIFVPQNYLAGFLKLLGDLLLILVVEAVTFVTEPNTNRYRQPKAMCLIKKIFDIIATPGPNGICTCIRELF